MQFIKNILILVLSLSLLDGCSKKTVVRPSKGSGTVPVSAITLRVGDIPTKYEYPAVVEPFNKTTVIPQVSGILLSHNFVEGGLVSKDQVLFKIDSKQYEAAAAAAKAKVSQTEEAYNQAKINYERGLKLLQQAVLSKSNSDSLKSKVEEAKSLYMQAKSDSDLANLNLERTQVKAPIAGRISNRLVEDGGLVSAGNTKLAVISQINDLYLNFAISSKDFKEIRTLYKEQKPIIKVSIYSNTGKKYPGVGTLDFTSPTIDQETGTVSARAVIHNNKDLLAGQFVRIMLEGINEYGIVIPEGALLQDSVGPYVYVLSEFAAKPGEEMLLAEQRRVKVKKQLYNRDWLIYGEGGGLMTGDKILTTGYVMVQNAMAKIKDKLPGVPVMLTNLDGKSAIVDN